jgi:hypothetical protein
VEMAGKQEMANTIQKWLTQYKMAALNMEWLTKYVKWLTQYEMDDTTLND